MRLDVRLEEFKEPIGTLESSPSGGISFFYSPEYMSEPKSMPISLSLPLQTDKFDDQSTRAFFDNLLPENNELHRIMERERIARDDIVGLLYWLGADCPGAISCLPAGASPQKIPGTITTDYEILSQSELNKIVHRLARQEPPFEDNRDPSPLAGVQRKIALTLLENGIFSLPKSGSKAPTTHIIKVPPRSHRRDVKLENAATITASKCLPIGVSKVEMAEFDGVPALIIERFDRIRNDGIIRRIHQEDFAQALGLPASMKYERNGKDQYKFNATNVASLLEKTMVPALAKREFLLATIFNFIIGNTDNHAKNHALIYNRGAAPTFAPIYDILPILLDKDVRHDMSFHIGNASMCDDVTREDFYKLMSIFGITRSAQQRLINRDVKNMILKIDNFTKDFTKLGLKDFDDMVGKQIKHIVETFSLDVDIRRRDYFRVTAGGWGWGS